MIVIGARELRMVPPTWNHPKDADGNFRPLFDGFSAAYNRWHEANEQWNNGFWLNIWTSVWEPITDDERHYTYAEWAGECPRRENYMPEWDAAEATHLMLYEITSEGTPLSPIFATSEELARWLATNRITVWADKTATYDQWLAYLPQAPMGFEIAIK